MRSVYIAENSLNAEDAISWKFSYFLFRVGALKFHPGVRFSKAVKLFESILGTII